MTFVQEGKGGACSEHLSCSWMMQSGESAQFVGSGSGAEAAEQLHCLSPQFTFISLLGSLTSGFPLKGKYKKLFPGTRTFRLVL